MSPTLDSNRYRSYPDGGVGRFRTDDVLLAKQVLYQLSYDPIIGRKVIEEKERSQRNLHCTIN